MNQTDAKKLADRMRRLADLIDTRGVKALSVAYDWIKLPPPDAKAKGPEMFTTRDKLDRLDPRRHARLVANLGRIDADTSTLTALILDTVPREPDKSTDCPEGACRNCWTDKRHYEPTAHWKDLCRWCGEFRQSEGRLPPLALLRKRHAGGKVTTADVEKALGRSA